MSWASSLHERWLIRMSPKTSVIIVMFGWLSEGKNWDLWKYFCVKINLKNYRWAWLHSYQPYKLPTTAINSCKTQIFPLIYLLNFKKIANSQQLNWKHLQKNIFFCFNINPQAFFYWLNIPRKGNKKQFNLTRIYSKINEKI